MIRSCAKSWCALRYLWLSMAIAFPMSQKSLCALNFMTGALFAKLVFLCLSSCLRALACSCRLAWFPLLLHRRMLFRFTVMKRMRERVATKEFVKRLRGSVSQTLISDLVRTLVASRSDLVKIAASQSPASRDFGKALQWSAAWSAAAAVVACVAASGHGAFFVGREPRRSVKGLEGVRKKPKA